MGINITNFGKFKLIKKIARGGMADIFIGFSGSITSAFKFIVIKRVLVSQSNNKEFTKMFLNEGKMTVNLQHSNIGHIYEFGQENNQYFICMEYISGRNVRQLMQKLKSMKKNIDISICAYIIRCVCDGLDYAHNSIDCLTGKPLNIIHRDISPQNIMISFEGSVKIIDFGIAKTDNSEATRVGVLKGKFAYMSPEQARGKAIDKQTDIFSLGNVLWELLAGRKLFEDKNELQILKKISEGRVTSLKKINPDVPEDLIAIVDKALNINKNIRYKNAADMSNDLSIFLNKFYPKLTFNAFSSYLKKVYVEEMLEENKILTSYSTALMKSTKQSIFSRKSSAKNMTNSFIGYKEDIKKETKPKSKSEPEPELSSYTATEYTETKNTSTQQSTQASKVLGITQTKFPDNLGDNTIRAKKSKACLNNNTALIESYNTNADSSYTQDTNHSEYLEITPNIKNNNRRTLYRHSNKNIKNKFLFSMIINVLVFGACGMGYYLRKDIHQYSTSILDKLFNNEIISSPNPGQNAKNFPKEEPRIYDRNPAQEKKITINTDPSGANIYIDNTKLDHKTPASITINNEVRLIFKRIGYYDRTITLSKDIVQKSLTIKLQKKETGNSNDIIIIK